MTTTAPPNHEASRLIPSDIDAIKVRLADVVAHWRQNDSPNRSAAAWTTLQHVGATAIGCSLADLRNSELDILAALVTEAIAR